MTGNLAYGPVHIPSWVSALIVAWVIYLALDAMKGER